MPGDQSDARVVFELLVREHADMLEAYLRAIVRRGSVVDDLFQETMIVAWRRLSEVDRSRSLAAWLRGIAHNLARQHARKQASFPAALDPAVLADLDRRFETLGRSPGDTFRDKSRRLAICLGLLPGAMAEALQLVYARGLSLAAAAGSLGASEEAVKKRVQRGRQMLAECMERGGTEHGAVLE